MAFADEVFKTLTSHLAQFRRDPPTCPICGNRDWAVAGPRNLMGFQPPPNEGTDLGTYAPMVMMVCTKCFFVHHFAWIAIREKAEERAKAEEEPKTEEKAKGDRG